MTRKQKLYGWVIQRELNRLNKKLGDQKAWITPRAIKVNLDYDGTAAIPISFPVPSWPKVIWIVIREAFKRR